MIKKIFVFLLLVLVFLPTQVKAANEFSTDSSILYDIDESGLTTVTENISLTNLTDRFYPESFDLTLGSTNITDIAALDSQGPLQSSSKVEGNKTLVNVKFDQQVAGKGKQYKWTIKFKSKDFAQKQGKIWQITVPKINTSTDTENFDFTLAVPLTFGEISTIIPNPTKQTESGGKLKLQYDKNTLSQSGIIANFGTEQVFDFDLQYQLQNTGLLPAVSRVVLPSDTPYQQVLISQITPKPENVITDQDGNFVAIFKVNRLQKTTVLIKGQAKVTAHKDAKFNLTKEQQKEYTSDQKYWEKDNPQIKNKLAGILGKDQTVAGQAQAIDKFVSGSLQYDQQRSEKGDYTRLGAVTVLNNTQDALCLEFSDLFIALARAANIPARLVIGYGYSSNDDLRPLSFQKNSLHAWPEYFDPEKGWVMIDPTWENTTGGVDYFSQFDLSHLAILTSSKSNLDFNLPSHVAVQFTDQPFTATTDYNFNAQIPQILFAGIPIKTTLQVKNSGNIALPSQNILIGSSKLDLKGDEQFSTPVIPPFGFAEYPEDFRTNSPLVSFDDQISIKVGEKEALYPVKVRPFFSSAMFSFSVVGVIILFIISYFTLVFLHLKHKSLQQILHSPHSSS